MNIVWALIIKDWKGFWSDKIAVMLTFFVPAFIIFLMGNIMGIAPKNGNNEGPGLSGIRLAAVDETDSDMARAMIQAVDDDKAFRIIRGRLGENEERIPLTAEDARNDIQNNRYRFALIFPEDAFAQGFGFKVKLIQNPRNQIETQTMEGLIQKDLMSAYFENIWDLPFFKADPELVEEWLDPLSELISEFWDVPEEEIRSVFREDSFIPDFIKLISDSRAGEGADGEELEDGGAVNLFAQLMTLEKEQLVGAEIRNPMGVQVVAGYSVMFLLFTMTGFASSFFEEKQTGIFLRLLSSPVRRRDILWSKYLFSIFLGMVQMLTMFIFSWALFQEDIFHSFGNLLIALLFVSAACTGIGMLITSVSKTPAQANGIGTLVIISMSAIGGAWFPVSFMAEQVQVFSRLTVVYWSVEALLRIMFEGKTLLQTLPVFSVLTLIAAVAISISLWRFNKGDLL
ncbi:MAG: ABC transporter permease [Opitutae bacterium]|nr:ABC transporter permease [Opitutae bacterium]